MTARDGENEKYTFASFLSEVFGKPRYPTRCDDANGLHVHTCRCGTTWQHPKDSDYPKAHECPKCGKEQFWKTDLADVVKIDFPWNKEEGS